MRKCSVDHEVHGCAPGMARSYLAWRSRSIVFMAFALGPVLTGCSGGGGGSGPSLSARSDTYDSRWGVSASQRVVANGPVPKGGGYHKLGKPYQVGGRWYVPRHNPSYDQTGVGSWYGHQFHGRKTANGEIFDMNALTAAHPTLPMPSYAYVTNLRNGRTILVRINDRGPYVAGREIDLSRASAKAIGYFEGGLSRVRVRWAGHAPLNGDDRREQAFLRNQPWSGGSWQMSDANDAPQVRRSASYDQRSAAYPPPHAPYGDRYPERQVYQSQAEARYEDEVPEPSSWNPDRVPPSRDAPRGLGQRVSAYNGAEQDWQPSPPEHRETRAEAMPAADEMWSPFDHRNSVKSTRRR